MYFDTSRSLFLDSRESGKVLFSSDLDSLESELASQYPDYIFVPSYWDIKFSYYFVDESIDLLGVRIILTKNDREVVIAPQEYLITDYFIDGFQIMPIRRHDYEALNMFLPTLERDGLTGMNILELMNFEYFCSTNQFVIDNSEFKDRVLASKNVDVKKHINDLTVEPYPYQVIGIEWLTSLKKLGLKGAILGDVMGLGKTLQAIGFITKNVNIGLQNNLVVCPGTLVDNWKKEINKFSPKLKVLIHFGKFRTGIPSGLVNYDVVITSYDALVADHAILLSLIHI